MRESKSSTILNLQRGHTRTNSSHKANALMPKGLVGFPKVLVCSVEARSYGIDEDFIVLEGLGDFASDNVALRGATEDVVCDAHIINFGRMQCVKEWENVVEGQQNNTFISPHARGKTGQKFYLSGNFQPVTHAAMRNGLGCSFPSKWTDGMRMLT